jgi:hypothetical protein
LVVLHGEVVRERLTVLMPGEIKTKPRRALRAISDSWVEYYEMREP